MHARTLTRRLAVVVATGVMAVVMVGLGPVPAGAASWHINRPTNVLSPQYEVNGCRYKIIYGHYGNAYARLSVYNPAACVGAGVILVYNAGSGEQVVSTSFSDGYTTGSDGCGSYRVIQATAPVPAFPIYAIAALPDAGGGLFNGWRFYAADGLAGQTAHSLC